MAQKRPDVVFSMKTKNQEFFVCRVSIYLKISTLLCGKFNRDFFFFLGGGGGFVVGGWDFFEFSQLSLFTLLLRITS